MPLKLGRRPRDVQAEPCSYEVTKEFGGFIGIGTSKSTTKLTLPRKLFFIGEKVPVQIQIKNAESTSNISHIELTLIQYMDIEVATPSLGLPYATFTKKNTHKFPKQYLKGLKKGQDLNAVFKLAIPQSTLN